jgi:hypothetical protein
MLSQLPLSTALRAFELRMVLDGPECVYDTYTMMQSPVNAC